MDEKRLISLGNDALYSGKDYTFSKIGTYTSEEAKFLNYLFSENRRSVVNDQTKQKTVQPEDLEAFKKSLPQSKKPESEKQTQDKAKDKAK